MLLGRGPKAKTFFVFEEFVVTNILTIIEKLSKKFDVPFDGFYKGLSEHSHPNAPAMVFLHTSDHAGGVTKFTDRNEDRARPSMILAISALATTLGMVESALEQEKALRIRFTILLEKHIYDRGTWPEGIAYRVKR